jgi:hypothetical protein
MDSDTAVSAAVMLLSALLALGVWDACVPTLHVPFRMVAAANDILCDILVSAYGTSHGAVRLAVFVTGKAVDVAIGETLPRALTAATALRRLVGC